MDKKENELQPQEAPLKNTDNAFVQVGKNGEPEIPETDKEYQSENNNRITNLDKR